MTKSKWPGCEYKQVVDVYDYEGWSLQKRLDPFKEFAPLFRDIAEDSVMVGPTHTVVIVDGDRFHLPTSSIVLVRRTVKVEEES